MSNITATCAKCGYIFDALLGLNCPACRVRKAFAPIDPLRTALGIKGLREDAELDGVWHWHGEDGAIGNLSREKYPGRLSTPNIKDSSTEVPQGCKMPKSEDGQIYELKRRFRL